MKDMTLLLALLGGEVLLILFVLLFVHWLRSLAAARRDRAAVAALVARVNESRERRKQEIADYLKRTFGMQGAAADPVQASILREELRLLQRFGLIYRKRDAASVENLPMFLEAAFEPYQALTGGSATLEAASPMLDADMAELEELRRENKRLSEELSVTMDTMSRMLSEYSTMFAGGSAMLVDSAMDALDDEEPEMQTDIPGDVDDDLPMRAPHIDQSMLDIGDEDELSAADSDAATAQLLDDQASDDVDEEPAVEEDGPDLLEIDDLVESAAQGQVQSESDDDLSLGLTSAVDVDVAEDDLALAVEEPARIGQDDDMHLDVLPDILPDTGDDAVTQLDGEIAPFDPGEEDELSLEMLSQTATAESIDGGEVSDVAATQGLDGDADELPDPLEQTGQQAAVDDALFDLGEDDLSLDLLSAAANSDDGDDESLLAIDEPAPFDAAEDVEVAVPPAVDASVLFDLDDDDDLSLEMLARAARGEAATDAGDGDDLVLDLDGVADVTASASAAGDVDEPVADEADLDDLFDLVTQETPTSRKDSDDASGTS